MLSMDHSTTHTPQGPKEMDVAPPTTPPAPAASDAAEGDAREYPEDANLFVGDLARNVKEMTLHHVFSKFGTVVSVDIKRDKITKNSLGYGFVQFAERNHAENAKRELHRFAIGGRSIRIGWAQKNTNLFIGDLDPTVTSERLREVFRKFGPLYEEETFVKHRNYGFVRFKNRGDAERAKREMDGQMLGTRPIRIGWGDAHVLLQKCCVHVQFDPAAHVTEDMLREAFRAYGDVVTVSLPRNGGMLKGFGFIHFRDSIEGETAAAKAMAEITRVGDVDIKCNYGKRQSRNKNRSMHARGGSLMYMSPYGAAYGTPYGTPYGAAYSHHPMFVPMDAHSAAAWTTYAAQWWMYGMPYANTAAAAGGAVPPQAGWNPYSNQYAMVYPMEGGGEYYGHAPPHAGHFAGADAAARGGSTEGAGVSAGARASASASADASASAGSAAGAASASAAGAASASAAAGASAAPPAADAAAPTSSSPSPTPSSSTVTKTKPTKPHTSKAAPHTAPPTASPAGAVVSPAKSGASAPATPGDAERADNGGGQAQHKKKKRQKNKPTQPAK